MALRTLGTAGTTTLSGIVHTSAGYADVLPADLAQMNALIRNDGLRTSGSTFQQQTFLPRGGLLTIPGRGTLNVKPGDFIAVDPVSGWPILLSPTAAASASFVHT